MMKPEVVIIKLPDVQKFWRVAVERDGNVIVALTPCDSLDENLHLRPYTISDAQRIYTGKCDSIFTDAAFDDRLLLLGRAFVNEHFVNEHYGDGEIRIGRTGITEVMDYRKMTARMHDGLLPATWRTL